jgi:hypothetical protein
MRDEPKRRGRPKLSPEEKEARKAAWDAMSVEERDAHRAARAAASLERLRQAKADPNYVRKPQDQSNKPWLNALRMELIQSDPETLRRLARALIAKAADGDVSALEEVADRLDGRSLQSVEAKVNAKVIITTDDAKL